MSRRLIFLLLLLLSGMAACVRSSSEYETRLPVQFGVSPSPTGRIGFTAPPSSLPQGVGVPTGTATLLATQPVPVLTMARPAPTITDTPGLPPEVLQTLALMPLVTGSSWVYSDEAYSLDEKAIWRISDTVVDNQIHPPYFAAKIQREVALVTGNPSATFINPPVNSVFWYLVSGNRVYRQDIDQTAGLSWNALENLSLEFIFPLTAKAGCWYPNPAQRRGATLAPGEQSALGTQSVPGCRQGGDGATQKFPAGILDRCHSVITPSNNGAEKIIFCDGVGIAERAFDHQGTRYGEHWLLAGYLVQTP